MKFLTTDYEYEYEYEYRVLHLCELGIQWVGVLAFGENCSQCSEICRATHTVSGNKNVAQRLYW